jgi:hypothetical protein
MSRDQTNCMFSVSGISDHQAAASRVKVGDLVSLNRDGNRVVMNLLDYTKIGYAPRYLETMLIDYIEGDPTGKFYAKVKWVGSNQPGNTVGIRCILLDSPSLPDVFKSEKPVLTVWESKAKGVTFTDYSDRQKNLKNAFDFTQKQCHYPTLAIRRQPDNSFDANAIMLFCLTDNEWLEIGYVAASDAAEIVQYAARGARFFSRILKLDNTVIEESKEPVFHATYEIVGYVVDKGAEVPTGFEELK